MSILFEVPEANPSLVIVALHALRDCQEKDLEPLETAERLVKAVLEEQWRNAVREAVVSVMALDDAMLHDILDSNPHIENRMRAVMDRELAKLNHPSQPGTVLRSVEGTKDE